MIRQISNNRRTTGNAKFSIIIPTWNNLAYLQLCVKSIRENSHYAHQIIVHVNEGKDGTLEWVNSQPDIDFTHSSENIGICYALNYCRHTMITDYLVYLNDDMYVCPGWDKVLHDEIEAIGHAYFFLSGTAIEPNTRNACYINGHYGGAHTDFREAALLKEYASFPAQDWLGATWPPNVVHKEMWDLVGGYSTEFSPGMYSDPDFSMKLWKLGVRLFKGLNQCRVYHFGSKSTKRVIRNKGYYTFINKWGITPGTFTRYYLRQGKPFNGPLAEPLTPYEVHTKNFFKRMFYAIQKNV